MGKGCYNINVLLLFIWIRIQNSLQNIKRIIKKKNSKQVARNRLQLKVSIEDVNFILELFIYLVHVRDTISLALEKAICEVLLHHCLNVDDIHGQGYDGVSNMHGEWNDLQALHPIRLYSYLSNFFYLTGIINLVAYSSKQHDQLRDIEASHIAELIDSNEFETGKGKNQVGTIQCPRNTQWGSHLAYLNSLMRIFEYCYIDSICVVLQYIIKSDNLTQMREVNGIYDAMTSIEFIFIFHFMIEMPRIIDDLYQVLQYKSQDILNAMQLVLSTNTLIQKFREHGLDLLFEKVKLFCKAHEIEVPNLSSPYKAVELPVISFGLDLRDNYKTFWVEDICKLMNDFYQENFTEQEKLHRKIQLKHFQWQHARIPNPCEFNSKFEPTGVFTRPSTRPCPQPMSFTRPRHTSVVGRKALTIVEFCQVLAKTNKSSMYPLFDRIMHLHSTMKIVKRRLCNRIEDDFLSTDLVAYVEKEIARDFSIDSIIDEFDLMKKRRVQFKMLSIEK
ncbi:hypothetical protein ES288_A01G177000v1 [Gossypium darwinii]|uniref:DUF4371 domain-containing protein n=1 Tax=Gossypium darwinii TaxID=34276 RepID=A0A5D2HMF8_GOSDA|nr:hypothetical protein ES288_A01G177000v1 [Gossypium darwinii]